jgi:hypothetical protein
MATANLLDRAAVPKVDLDSVVRRQRGIVTRAQLIASGIDDDAIRRELREGHWQRILPGLYATFSGELTLEQRRVAATQYAPNSQITGLSALVWYGARNVPSEHPIHLLVRHGHRRSSRGFVKIHRTHRLDPYARSVNGYEVCSVARATADACRHLEDLREVRAIVAEVVQRRLTTVDALRREQDLAGSSRTRLLRTAVREVESGSRSAPEAELREVCRSSRIIPLVLWNPRLVAEDGTPLPTPDGWIDSTGIAIEVDSREYHLNPSGWQSTMRRHNLLSARGALVLHFTPSEIRSRRSYVRRVIEHAYRERVSTGARASVRIIDPVDQ